MIELFGVTKKSAIKVWRGWCEGNTYHVAFGKLDGKVQVRSVICGPKNVGRANETTGEQQALLELQAKAKKKYDKNYRSTIEEARAAVGASSLPMLASDFTKVGHAIDFPCFVSKKLDGVRCIAYIYEDNVVLNSRGGRYYDCPQHIRDALLELSAKTGIKVFDGELYIHGLKLQQIVSCVKKHNERTPQLTYQIFDLPFTDEPWTNRWVTLSNWVAMNIPDDGPLHVVENKLVSSHEEAYEELQRQIADGYEGLMLRNRNGLYESSYRSLSLQKWKLMYDTEALVLAVRKDKLGEAVLLCRTVEYSTDFECKIKGTHEERSYEALAGSVGKWLTYKYQAFTQDNVPQFAVGLYFRECDNEGNPLD